LRLHCLDDDAAGQALDVIWELELGAQVVDEGALELGKELDAPSSFGAWLQALRWSCVTSTEKDLFQAPFRAGIAIKPYQLEPLRKALDLPRVNLFIADDVGLGKTIEAGLVLQELLLRQRVDRVLVVCPPSVARQWQEELAQRFGLSFAIYDREWIAARRRERGWGINPWLTHPRLIVSYPMLRGSERTKGQHLALLLASLGDKLERSLLILDEVHQVAPASGAAYAVDTRTTYAIRQIVHRFEHRLFLSATPHNGHSNSFSTLLEMLDPQRFTRGVKVAGVQELEPVMVRRLKRDLRAQVGGLPERVLVDHQLRLAPEAPELVLGKLLAHYEDLYRAALRERGLKDSDARALVCVNLHKRLLSSVTAFHRTLEAHARAVERLPEGQLPLALRPPSQDEDLPLQDLEGAEQEWVEAASFRPGESSRALLAQLRELAARHKHEPDARLRHLAAWVQEHLCPGGRWNQRRLIVFTEYDDTLGWIARELPKLLSADADGRLGRYTGATPEHLREALKTSFNADPARDPLRILLCTDAAREGINLQAHCTDLFHFDLPWNPSRVEQRNGRIDRTLQPAPQVWCHYFDLPDRPEDRVLGYMVRKLHRITEELGSLSEVLSERLAQRMEQGIRALSPEELDRLAAPDRAALEAAQVLESRAQERTLQGDHRRLQRILDASRHALGYKETHLRGVVELGLRMASTDAQGLSPVPEAAPPAFHLPPLDASWSPLLEPMRELLPDDAPPWAVAPLRPVVFEALDRMDAPAVQLHLAHPMVKRLLARFTAQGFASHELHRLTLLQAPDRQRRALAFGRLVLFGRGAARLHEELVEVVAALPADGDPKPLLQAATERTLARLADQLAEGPALHPDPDAQAEARRRAPQDMAALAPHLRRIAEAAEQEARQKLKARAQEEAQAMRDLLHRQAQGIQRTQREMAQVDLLSWNDRAEREQFERDRRFMDLRLEQIKAEQAAEPAAILRAYEVALTRFEPLGLLYLWP
jgi:superfamily II DNA or RNA helicase